MTDHAHEVLAMKERVELMWATNLSKRMRKTSASTDTPGYSLFGDNVGSYSYVVILKLIHYSYLQERWLIKGITQA